MEGKMQEIIMIEVNWCIEKRQTMYVHDCIDTQHTRVKYAHFKKAFHLPVNFLLR